jgi:hypothetical protein
VAVVGNIPAGLPEVALPRAGLEQLGALLLPAVGIAFLVFADSGVTARAPGRRTGDTVDASGAEKLRRVGFQPLGLMREVPGERSLGVLVTDAHLEEPGVLGCCRRRRPRCTGG